MGVLIEKAGVVTGAGNNGVERNRLNIIEGSGVSITLVDGDDPSEAKLTFNAAGGGIVRVQEIVSDNFTLDTGDNGKLFVCTSPLTITVPADLGDTFQCEFVSDAAGIVTLDGTGVVNESINPNGLATLVQANGSQRVWTVDTTIISGTELPVTGWQPDLMGPLLVHWWDARDASTMTFDATSGKVVTWTDKMSGIVATQSTDASRPELVGNEIRFDGTNIRLLLPQLSRSYLEHTWYAMLLRANWTTMASADGSFFQVGGGSNSAGQRQPQLSYTKAGTLLRNRWYAAGALRETTETADGGDEVWMCIVARRSHTGTHSSLNGEATETDTLGNLALPIPPSGLLGMIGDLKTLAITWGLDSLLIGQGNIDDGAIDKIHGWALWRVGEEDSLPVGHTYKDDPPPIEDQYETPPDANGDPTFDWDDIPWVETNLGDELDLTGYTLTFEDHFTDISTVTDGVSGIGPWYAPARPDTSLATFRSPTQTNQQFSQPEASVLRIGLSKIGATWYCGHIQTVNTYGVGFTQRFGYFEARMRFDKNVGWPAFWLYGIDQFTDTSQTRVELDVVEAYGDNDYTGHHCSVHRHDAYRHQPGHLTASQHHSNYSGLDGAGIQAFLAPWDGDMFDGDFHTYGMEVNEDWIISYIDGFELGRHPTYLEATSELFMLVSMQMQDAFIASAVDTYMDIDYVRAYELPSGPVDEGFGGGEFGEGGFGG